MYQAKKLGTGWYWNETFNGFVKLVMGIQA
jgi:hypothetical protein